MEPLDRQTFRENLTYLITFRISIQATQILLIVKLPAGRTATVFSCTCLCILPPSAARYVTTLHKTLCFLSLGALPLFLLLVNSLLLYPQFHCLQNLNYFKLCDRPLTVRSLRHALSLPHTEHFLFNSSLLKRVIRFLNLARSSCPKQMTTPHLPIF